MFTFGPPQPRNNNPKDSLHKYLAEVAAEKELLDLERVKQILRDQEAASVSIDSSEALFFAIKTSNIPTVVADLLVANGLRIKGKELNLLEEAPVDRIQYALEHLLDLELAEDCLQHVIKRRPHPDKIPLIELLLKFGVNVNHEAPKTPIVTAMDNLDATTVEYLLTQKIQPVWLNSTPQTPLKVPPLHATATPSMFSLHSDEDWRKRMATIAKMLVDAGADVNGSSCKSTTTPLTTAITWKNVELALFLLEKGAQPSVDGEDIQKACRNKLTSVVKALLERGANAKKLYGDLTLFHAALDEISYMKPEDRNKILELLELLGQYGTDPNHSPPQSYEVPLSLANTPEQFQILLKYGAKLTYRRNNTNLIHLMLCCNNLVNFEYVLQQGVLSLNEKNAKGYRPLHVASQTVANSHAVELLIKYGAEIDALDDSGRTALVHALNVNSDALEILLRNGTNVMLSDHHGDNIMHHLARNKTGPAKIFVTLAKFICKDQALQLLSQQNLQGKTPVELTNEREIQVLFSLDLKLMGRARIDIFGCTKLFENELKSIARGVEYIEFDSSHWNSSDDLVQQAAIFALPFEALHAILLMTHVKDIASFSMTCRQFKLLTDSDTMWKSIRNREGYGNTPTYQNLKKDYVLQQRFSANMADRNFYNRSVTFDPPALTNPHYRREGLSLQWVPHCDLDARLVSVTSSLGQVALIDLATVTVTKDIPHSPSAVLHSEGTTTVRTNLSKQKFFTVVHEREKRELYFREHHQESFMKLRTDCDGIDVEGTVFAYIHNQGNNNFCDVINVATKAKSRIVGNFNNVVLNGNVVALSNQNHVVELWDIKTTEKIYMSKLRHPTYHVMFKFGNFIVSMGNGIEFIDCERKVSTTFPHQTSVTDTYTIDANHQVLVTSNASCSNVLIWRPTLSGGITREALNRPPSPLPAPQVYPGAPKSYVLPSLLKLAATKDMVFFANDQYTLAISCYNMATATRLYEIPVSADVRALHLGGPYLFAVLQNGTMEIINYNW